MVSLLAPKQHQTLEVRVDQKIILAARLLQCNTLELETEIEQEVAENPALERIETGEEDSALPKFPAGRGGITRVFDGDFVDSDTESDPIGNAVDQSMTLREYLNRELRAQLPACLHFIAEYILDNLDEHGLLPNFDIDRASLETGASPEEILEVLEVLQSLDPSGIGARSVQECMLLQLRDLREQGQGNPLAEQIVQRYFDRLLNPPLRRMARELQSTPTEVQQAIKYIKEALHPYPAYRFRAPWQSISQPSRDIIKPDVIIRRNPEGFEVDVVRPGWLLILSPEWRKLYEDVKKKPSEYPPETVRQVYEYVERAERFLYNLETRYRTLRRIAMAVVSRQFAFIETGSHTYLKPLTRTEIAKELEMHESVVSRAISNKWVLLPNGDLIPFSNFFTPSLSIQQAIQQVVHSEDGHNPYSDDEIAQILYDRWGIKASRRTVVKYRNRLHIPSSRERKRPK